MRCTFISLLVTLAVMAVSASLDPGSLTLERSGIVVHRSNQLRQMTWMFNVLLLLFILIMVREGCSELGRLPRPAAPRTRQERNDHRGEGRTGGGRSVSAATLDAHSACGCESPPRTRGCFAHSGHARWPGPLKVVNAVCDNADRM